MRIVSHLRLCLVLFALAVVGSLCMVTPTAHAATPPHSLTATATVPSLPGLPSLPEALRAMTPACQRTARPADSAGLSVTYAAFDATNTPIIGNFNMPALPYTVTYATTVTNTGTTATPATSLLIYFGDYFQTLYHFDTLPKPALHKVPALAPHASVTFTVKHTYTSGQYTFLAGIIDPECQQVMPHPPLTALLLGLFAPTADLFPVVIMPLSTDGTRTLDPTQLLSDGTFKVVVTMINLGQTAPTGDVTLRFASPLIGPALTMNIPAASLPTPGEYYNAYLSDSMANTLIFTTKTVTNVTHIPFSGTLTMPPGDTSKATTRTTTTKVEVLPRGIDLSANISVNSCCLAGAAPVGVIEG